jgi:hypothetical protein
LERETLEDLRKVMDRHKGKCQVMFHFIVPGKGELFMRAGGGVTVNPSKEFITSAEELLGEESVTLE